MLQHPASGEQQRQVRSGGRAQKDASPGVQPVGVPSPRQPKADVEEILIRSRKRIFWRLPIGRQNQAHPETSKSRPQPRERRLIAVHPSAPVNPEHERSRGASNLTVNMDRSQFPQLWRHWDYQRVHLRYHAPT